MKNQKGITLVALIITIIVMLILVAVSVGLLISSDILGTAKKAGDDFTANQSREENLGWNDVTVNGFDVKPYLTDVK